MPTDGSNPYEDLAPEAFWRTAIADLAATEIRALWTPKWPIGAGSRIATAGSCFARHFGTALRARGFAWIEAEPAPGPLPLERREAYGYGLFSSRTGNIYTARQLLQWLSWALDPDVAAREVWTKHGRWFDPFRPNIEPDGFLSREELMASRRTTLACLLDAVKGADLFVFTLGLTECWRNVGSGVEYASCPGTIAGEFDSDLHHFHNQVFAEVLADMEAVIGLLRRLQPEIRLLLTVSPVPLTATASGRHVLVATAHSKSVLRAVAGELANALPFCDYFPSYEIVTMPPFRGMFFAPNLRSISRFGVDFVMERFFDALQPRAFGGGSRGGEGSAGSLTADPLCDDALLDRFAKA